VLSGEGVKIEPINDIGHVVGSKNGGVGSKITVAKLRELISKLEC